MTVQLSATTGARPARTSRTRSTRTGAAARAYDRRTARAAAARGAGSHTRSARSVALAARVPFVALVIGLLSVGLVVTLLLTTKAAEGSYQLSDAREYNQSLTEQKAALERDVAAANSAPQLAQEAAALGMVPAVDPARLVVHDDGSVEVVGTPKPAEGAPVAPLDRPAAVSSGANVGTATSRSAPVAPSTRGDDRRGGTENSRAATDTRAADTRAANDTDVAAREGQLVPVSPAAPQSADPRSAERPAESASR
ncbi:hypothetical protein [Rhodococcus sp. HNM0569]|uniref:hypothetical protein n=1 Tax=Rhodococcus sp. HNM0569 TaxID=2716340 RepID=UPI00146D64B1|nr:hypothetical protein [Rhodococcus sp. HNM0569]NLU82914.1 hypothetical protein [Rhodococcus sp. HNM0569]